MEHILDRPVWTALTTRQAELGLGDARARRYRPEINLFAAAADRTPEQLEALAALADGTIGTVEAEPLPALPGLGLRKEATVNQMIATGSPGLVDGFAPVPLGEPDAAEMLALATLTEPGPFRTETWRMGRFVGIREGGRLVAMAGERMRAPGFTEVSGVCTHPDFQGRGYAGKLMRAVIDRIIGEGDAAFLHVYPHNQGAIGLYEALGFRFRAQLSFQIWASDP
jgi:ribosomal protein S18 acetylase RimI-like enzyme